MFDVSVEHMALAAPLIVVVFAVTVAAVSGRRNPHIAPPTPCEFSPLKSVCALAKRIGSHLRDFFRQKNTDGDY